MAPSFHSCPQWLQPPLLRPDRVSVLISSTPSSFPSISDSLLGLLEAHYLTVLSQCNMRAHAHAQTQTEMQPCQPGLVGVVLCRNARPSLYLWRQAVLKPTRSLLVNITPVPLRTAAPSILCCTPVLRDVITRLLAVSALRVSSSVFFLFPRLFPLQWIYRALFLFLIFCFLANSPRPEILNRSEQ